MKRTISFLLTLALLLALLPACAQSGPAPEPAPAAPEPEVLRSARELADMVLPFSGHDGTLDLEYLNEDEDAERLSAYIEAVCGLTAEAWEDAAVIRGTGASAFEIIVLRLGDGDAAGQAEAVLADYPATREGAFTGYAPAEADMASSGKVRREGRYVAVFICPDPAGAEAAFTSACSGEELPAPPAPAPEPEPEEEPDDFTPVASTRDIVFRLMMDAAYPEWVTDRKEDVFRHSDQKDITEHYYGISTDEYVDYLHTGWGIFDSDYMTSRICYWSREVDVFLAPSEEGAAELVQKLDALRAERIEEFQTAAGEGNADAAEALAVMENAQTLQAGRYAALIACDHMEDTVRLFPRVVNDPNAQGSWDYYLSVCLGEAVVPDRDMDPDYPDRVLFAPPGEEDMSLYDTSAILAAWEAGDPSALSGDDRATYDAAEAILSEIIQDGMTDLEKETAVYDWIVENVNYDWTHMDALAETDRRSYEPYGGLVNRSAVCLGYAASFQLLMDMVGIECITVVGADFNGTGDHSWNQVKLNGEWYCVDATWDANSREIADIHEWRNFNLTSDEMALNHQWDYANTPEATAEDRGGAA